MSTHTGRVSAKNEWGVDISTITIRHRRGNDPNKQEEKTFYLLQEGATTDSMTLTYETGIGSPFDYWWIKFVTIASETWTIKDDFFCYISSSDNGIVLLTLEGDDHEMKVTFSSSSSCSVSVYKDAAVQQQERGQ